MDRGSNRTDNNNDTPPEPPDFTDRPVMMSDLLLLLATAQEAEGELGETLLELVIEEMT